MPSTVIPARFHRGFRFDAAGSITTEPIGDCFALADASNSNANSKATVWNTIRTLERLRTRHRVRVFADFIQGTALAVGDDRYVGSGSGTGAGIATSDNDFQGRCGIIELATGTDTNSHVALIPADNVIRLGGAKWFYETAIRVPTLSTSGERYWVFAGFFDRALTNNAIFIYDEGGIFGNAAGYWQTYTVAASSVTRNTSHTQVTVAVDTWYRLGVEVNDNASEVKYYVDGALVGTHTATIPTASGQTLLWGVWISKNTGNTNRTLLCDYILGMADFTSLR